MPEADLALLLALEAIAAQGHQHAGTPPRQELPDQVGRGLAGGAVVHADVGDATRVQHVRHQGHHRDASLREAPDRRPHWPDSIAGSITHTDTYCAAAVARRADLAGVGIDAERLGRVEDALLPRICTEDEQARLATLSPSERALAATLIFSAKEAFYKCHVSAGGGLLGFHDVALDYGADSFRVLPQHPFTKTWTGEMPPAGHYKVNGDTILCAVAFPAR